MADGKIRLTVESDIKIGAILRETSKDGDAHPMFPDYTIVQIENAQVELVRPYLTMQDGEILMRTSRMKVEMNRLLGGRSIFRTVLEDRGQPSNCQA